MTSLAFKVNVTPIKRRKRGNPNPTGRLALGARKNPRGIKKLQQVHHEVINLAALGTKPKDIAAILGVSTGMVDYTVNGALGQEKLNLIRGARDADTVDLAEEIRKLGPIAIDRVKQVIEDANATNADALRAAFGMLDRIPETATTKRIQSDSRNMHFTPDDIKRMQEEAFKQEALTNR